MMSSHNGAKRAVILIAFPVVGESGREFLLLVCRNFIVFFFRTNYQWLTLCTGGGGHFHDHVTTLEINI